MAGHSVPSAGVQRGRGPRGLVRAGSVGACLLVVAGLAACAGQTVQSELRQSAAAGVVSATPSAAAIDEHPPIDEPVDPVVSESDGPPCAGSLIDLVSAFTDARCVFDDTYRARAIGADLELFEPRFEMTGSVLADGRVEVRLHNPAKRALVLPFHLTNPTLTDRGHNFVTHAERPGQRAVLLHESQPDWGTAVWSSGFYARAVVAPGGVAFIRLRIDPHVIERRIPKNCPPWAKCLLETVELGPLPKGDWELFIKLPLLHLNGFRDATASVGWTAP